MVEYPQPDLDGVFHALADGTRRALVQQLAAGRVSVTELSRPHPMSLAAVSKHLKVLEGAGLVRRDIVGRVHHCSLDRRPFAQVAGWLRNYTAFWDERLDALADLLEAPRKTGDA